MKNQMEILEFRKINQKKNFSACRELQNQDDREKSPRA